ncbi:MAG TPA: acyl-CoA dehydrogenase family protein [Acidimicrobiales bacterium]|nr:acyl-CoA dehydrogenase family protein [Acidimicrobiales bacterium]
MTEPAPIVEPFDHLPFGSDGKSRRYDTSRYRGAVGLNWYLCDPSLQFIIRSHLDGPALAWAEPRLEAVGELMGGPIAERAEETDRNPPRLEKYDRWGHDVSLVVTPPSFEASKRDLLANSFSDPAFRSEARAAGVDPGPMAAAWSYMLNQAEIGMTCALGTGGDMVVRLAEEFAPEDVKARLAELVGGAELGGEAAQMLTERTGGSDLAALETTATPAGDAWRLNGLKWFASNANGSAFVVLAKPEGAPDTSRGIVPFLVLRERRDGGRNGVMIRRLKDKLGTKAVASAEVELVDAEAFMLAPGMGTAGSGSAETGSAGGDGRGLARMMELTNGARLGIAMMGLGCARRALVEALCYARAREVFGSALIDQPLAQRKLAELIVEVEAAQALVFDGFLGPRLRLGAPLIKLRAARLGITAASDAIEMHGGNGYIEQWPVARLLRDAQVNTIWEGPDNILCLDVRRSIRRDQAETAFLERLRSALATARSGDQATVDTVSQSIELLEEAIGAWKSLDGATAEARLYTLATLMVDVYAASLLIEQAGSDSGDGRKSLVARLYVRSHLGRDRLRGLLDTPDELERFKELVDGTFADPRG